MFLVFQTAPDGNQVYRHWEQTSPEGYHKEKRVGFVGVGLHTDVVAVDMREFNGINQQIKVIRDNSVSEYYYRPDGLRYAKMVGNNTITQLWDGQNLVCELNTGGGVRGRYHRGLALIAQEQDGQLYSYTLNGHGDVIQRSTTSYNSPAYDYDAFGVERGRLATDPNPFRYCGEYYDSEIDNIYLRARYYDPGTGRFVSEASHWDNQNMVYGDNPDKDSPVPDINVVRQSSNLYSYCIGNPVKQSDPSGKIAIIDDAVFVVSVVLIIVSAVVLIETRSVETTWLRLVYKISDGMDIIKEYAERRSAFRARSKEKSQADGGYEYGGESTGALDEVGEANTYQEKVNEETGELEQRRYYGDDGRASYDTDYSHGHEDSHTFPHDHYWDWSNPKMPKRYGGVPR